MNNQNFTFVANWKMSMSMTSASSFFETNYDELAQLAQLPKTELIICPSFTELTTVSPLTKKLGLFLGAQDCSTQKPGAYTGQISAEQLAEVGCTYSIVGHSERRIYAHESNQDVAQKTMRLLEVGLIPIVCVGETQQEYQANKTQHLLNAQLNPLVNVLTQTQPKLTKMYIAYEPVWAIGTGIVPETTYINQVFNWIAEILTPLKPQISIQLLYGGSVNEQTSLQIATETSTDGFLIGTASLDFKKFKNIVLLKNSRP